MEKRNFIILLILLIAGSTFWMIFVYKPKQDEVRLVTDDLKQIMKKVSTARHAKLDIKNIEKRFSEVQHKLELEKARFIKKNELYLVTETLNKLAAKHDLKLLDFAPEVENYVLAEEAKITALPLLITLRGNFLDIGSYIEQWPDLPFYLIPEGILVEKVDEYPNELRCVITTKLYTWNN